MKLNLLLIQKQRILLGCFYLFLFLLLFCIFLESSHSASILSLKNFTAVLNNWGLSLKPAVCAHLGKKSQRLAIYQSH